MTAIVGVAAAAEQQNSGTSASSTAANSVNENFDLFLTLLTTQLQNQDPLDPMDTAEMTSQLVQYSQVEQTIATNTNLETLISLSKAQSGDELVNYIGKEVEALNSSGKLVAGENVDWRYSLAADSTEVTLSVVDANGATIYSETVEADAGTHDFTWDGKNKDGATVSEGTYFLSVSAVDSKGEPIQTDVRMTGTVDSVDYTVNPPVVMVNGIAVELSTLTSASNPKTTTQ